MTITKQGAVFGAILIWSNSACAGTVTLHNRVWQNGVVIDIRIGIADSGCEVILRKEPVTCDITDLRL
jgi:hypothetical protein